MPKKTQADIIVGLIEAELENGVTDKSKIYDKIEREDGYKRPTIRRVARDLKIKYQQRINALEIASLKNKEGKN